MQVIRHGNTYREVECRHCGALLSYCKSEVKVLANMDVYDGEWHESCKKYIMCPECKRYIVLSLIIDGEETVK